MYTTLNCLQFLSETFFNLRPFFIVPPQFAAGNLMGKMMKQKILACTKIIHHRRSDIQLQYQSTIFNEFKAQLPYLHHAGSLLYPDLQKFSPYSHIILFKYPTTVFSPRSTIFSPRSSQFFL
jgi:hypothetical protein